MKKHTSTTRMIGSGYPLSVKLLDFWYYHRDGLSVAAIVLAIVLLALVSRQPAPVSTPPPVILIATPAAPDGHPAWTGAGAIPAPQHSPAPQPTMGPTEAPIVQQGPAQSAQEAPAEVVAPPTVEPPRAEAPAWEPPAPVIIVHEVVVTAEPPPAPTDMPLNAVHCDYGCGEVPPAAAPTAVVDPNYRKDDFKEPDPKAVCAFVGCLAGH